ncbi:hypothetical protein GCM10023237_28430 [Streptomyces coeruleoprunus]
MTARAGLALERRRLEPLVALRAAGGLALVVLVSNAAFGPAVAASSAFGAFQAAIATFQRSWRPRPTLALASGVSLAVSTFLAYLAASAHQAVFVALLVLWTFLSGLAWVVGPTVGLMASSNVAIMLVTVTFPTSVAGAAAHAGVIAAGGVVQAGLIVLLPVRRWGAQRDALADALAAEADYARRLRHDPYAPFDPVPLMTARSAAAVTRRQARTRPAELHGVRGVAERIRPVLASLADPAVGAPEEGPGRDRVRELLAAAAAVLDAAAHAVRYGEPVAVPPDALAALRTPDTAALLAKPPARRAAARLAALLGDVVETAAPTDRRASPEELRTRPPLLTLVPGAVRDMRAELRADSPFLRHAVRVSAVAATGYAVGTALPLGHGYWAPLASVMSMRPDFSQTYARSVARFGGTLLGVALATGVVQATDPGTYTSAGLAVFCAFGMYLLMRTGYAAAQVCVSAYVVFLLGMAGEAWTQTVPERVLLTLLGGVLAMLAYAVYPAWETPRLRTRLADRLTATGRYAAEVLAGYARPDRPGRGGAVREAVLATRSARVAWQEAVERAAHEPVRHRGLSRAAADGAGEALSRLARAAMLLEAHLPARSAAPVPVAAALAEVMRLATERGAADIRERRVPHWDEVRAALESADAQQDPLVRAGARQLLDALEELTDALDDDA